MKILGIDTSANVASVAIVQDDVLICEYTLNYKLTHSQTLMPMIDEICKACEFDMSTLDFIAVASGPGSFTGLRIGAATAKGLAQGLNIPIVAVPTLDGLACNVPFTKNIICPIMDARRGQVYTSLYIWNDNTLKRITDYMSEEMDNLLNIIKEDGSTVIFLGDGVPVYKTKIEENLDEELYSFAPLNCNIQRAASIAALGKVLFEQGISESYLDFSPFYLRKSQAEREYEEKIKSSEKND